MVVVPNMEENLLLVEVRNGYNDVLLILFDHVVVGMEDDMVEMVADPNILGQIEVAS